MLIEKHISWIALNNIVGCPNNCAYCFLDHKKGVAPKVECDPDLAVQSLMNSSHYRPDTPVAIMVNTDAFATKQNSQECIKILKLVTALHFKNLFILVTKRLIQDEVAKELNHLMKQGLKLLVYVSYSGLPSHFEQGTWHNGTPDALITMQTLKKHHIPCAHYWRPLLPQNTSYETLKKVYMAVKDYCIGSLIMGLKLYSRMETPYWPKAAEAFKENPSNECIIPKGSLEKIYKIVGDYPIFLDNFCLLAVAQNIPCRYGIYGSIRCQQYNCCPYKKLSINPCSSVTQPLPMTCDQNYWGNSSKSTKWIEI